MQNLLLATDLSARSDRALDRAVALAREVIHGEINRLRPDLLVIGTHGRTGVAHAFLGSVAEDLLSSPTRDVMAVKAW